MERIGKEAAEAALSRLLPHSEATSLVQTSGLGLNSFEVDELETLMTQTVARYPNQMLPQGTPEMYAALWAEIVQRFGMKAFVDALSKVIRRSRFFPDPLDIREECEEARRDEAAKRRQENWRRQYDADKAAYERDKAQLLAEMKANPTPPVMPKRNRPSRDELLVKRRAELEEAFYGTKPTA